MDAAGPAFCCCEFVDRRGRRSHLSDAGACDACCNAIANGTPQPLRELLADLEVAGIPADAVNFEDAMHRFFDDPQNRELNLISVLPQPLYGIVEQPGAFWNFGDTPVVFKRCCPAVGEHSDEILREIGQVGFWKVAMKPGRPLAFGHINDAVFFGLPGNPVSVMVTFYQFVQPALRKIMGAEPQPAVLIKATAGNVLKKRPGRVEYQRGILTMGSDGQAIVHTESDQGSGILSSMSNANCFVVLPMDSGRVEPGEPVDVQLFHGLM